MIRPLFNDNVGKKKKKLSINPHCGAPFPPDIRFLCRSRNSEIGYYVVWRCFSSLFKLDPNNTFFSRKSTV